MSTLDPFRFRSASGMIALLLLAAVGCANREVSGTFRTQSPPPFSASGQMIVPDRWWLEFGDPDLNGYVNQAVEGSFTLAAALQRLRAARALTRREASDLFPDLNGIADIGSVFGSGRDVTTTVLGFDAAYQVDLWGQIESRVEAERLRAAATDADYQAVALSLSAAIAGTWFSMIEANAQLELLEEQTETNRRGLARQEAAFELGLIGIADVLRQQQLVESTLEQTAVVKARIELLEHQFAVLLGEFPQTAGYDSGSALPALPPLPDTGLSSELLQRRPDVRRDYLAFMAADRDLASAISAQYPRISLTGSVLNVAERPEDLFREWITSIGAQLIAPLFDGGQRRAEVDRTAAVVAQLFNEYGQTTLIAFREVEDALARERYQLERLEHLNEQVELARQSSERLREEYLLTPDETDYLSVLTSITAEQRLQRDILAAQLELVQIRIGLYLALAGGFEPRLEGFPGMIALMEEQPVPEEAAMPEQQQPLSEPVPIVAELPAELPSTDGGSPVMELISPQEQAFAEELPAETVPNE